MAKLLFPIILLFFAGAAHAASPGDVVINEIAWMGSPAEGNETASQAANDEWLELFNTGANAIDLSGWVLKSTDNNPTIQLGGSGEILRIEAGAYFLLSRANQTVVGVSADLVYPYDTTKSSLGNSGEHLQLLDAGRNVIDDINAFGNWFAGDNITKQTMERKHPQLSGSDPDSWGTSVNPGGTPKSQNSVYQSTQPKPNPEPEVAPPPASPAGEPAPASDPTPGPEPVQTSTSTQDAATSTGSGQTNSTISYPDSIFINELMPFPQGPDELEEWIEITNESDLEQNISLWVIKDTAGVTNSYIFPNGSTISARGFLVFSRPTSKITLNNDNDGLNLIKPDGQIAQILYYDKAPKGSSFARTQDASTGSERSNWQWSSVPTPGSANIVPALPQGGPVSPIDGQAPTPPIEPVSPKPKPSEPASTKLTQSEPTIDDLKEVVQKYKEIEKDEDGTLIFTEKNEDAERAKQIASILDAGPQNKNKLVIFGAIFLALFSGVFIFLLRKRIKGPLR